MLDGIRANAQSWGVKLAFGIIIIVFVFWGIGSYSGPKGIVATVNGEKITEMEFRRAYAQMEQNIRQSMPDVTQEMLQSLQLEQQVLQSLVVQKLLQEEANRVGVNISPWELRRAVEGLPYFLDKNGKFDQNLYVKAFEGTGRTVSQFEDELRGDMLPQKMQTLLTAGAWSDPKTARAMFDFQEGKRTMDYMLFPMDKHMAASAPSAEEIENAYKQRADLYALPPRVRLEYVALNPVELGKSETVTDEAIAAAYDARRDQFTVPEKVHARHILVAVPENAPQADVQKAESALQALEARIKGGEDFAAVAKEASQDGSAAQGGDLGWFTREQMVPAFADAAFALKAGDMSSLVRSPFGFHLIKVEERQAATTRSLDDVKQELRNTLAAEEAAKGLQDKSDAVLSAALGGKDMKAAAEAAGVQGLEVMDSGLIAADLLGKQLGLRAADIQSVMNTPAGTVVDTALPTSDGMLVIRVAESLPQMTRPLDEVREELTASLTRDKARKLALEDARKARAAFKDDFPSAELAAEVKRSEPFGRDGYVAGLGFDLNLSKALFAVPALDEKTRWLPEAFVMDDGAVLARPAESILPGDAQWKEAAAAVEDNLRNSRASMLFQSYLMRLNKEAEIKILNPALFQPKAAPKA